LNWFIDVLYISKPVAGDEIASRWVVVILGTNAPFVVDETSNMAEASADGLVAELIATPVCATEKFEQKKKVAAVNAE
jgi:hypothetical protein